MSDTDRVYFGSLTRIADLPPWPFPFAPLPRAQWASGDYVVAEVEPYEEPAEGFELPDGREVTPLPGDLLIGAFSRRFATLEAAGSFEAIGDDGRMHSMSEAGCFGRVTSKSRFSVGLMPLLYRGHVLVDGRKLTMADCAPPPPETAFDLPVLMIVGTSMSAGKTLAGRVAVRQLKALGFSVAAAKLTGTGRRHDVLSMADAGADHVFDFTDAGLPTTVCDAGEYRDAIGGLLRRIADTGVDVVVVEAGASPLEPYNGGTAVEMLEEHVFFTILCASDPYAVVGIQRAWDRHFDLVAGPAANTEAGVQLVDRLASLPALDLMDGDAYPRLRQMLTASLEARGVGA